jgi:hypothetical protein
MSEIDILGLYLGIRERAVRWEGLETYRVPWEDDQLDAWRRGDPPPLNPAVEASLDTIRRITGSGRRLVRLRGMRRPASEYTRYELEVAYPPNVAAGEEIYVVNLDEHPDLDGIEDFVVFDADAVVRYRYDAAGHLLRYELTDRPAEVAEYAAVAERLFSLAVPLAQFLAEVR